MCGRQVNQKLPRAIGLGRNFEWRGPAWGCNRLREAEEGEGSDVKQPSTLTPAILSERNGALEAIRRGLEGVVSGKFIDGV